MLALTTVVLPSVLSLPSAKLQPAEVVAAQLHALQLGDFQQAFAFTSPRCRRGIGSLAEYSRMLQKSAAFHPLLDHWQHEVTSALTISSTRWQCCVRVEHCDRGGTGALREAGYRWELSRQGGEKVLFGLGQCVRHRKEGYTGVVVGWDDVCRGPEGMNKESMDSEVSWSTSSGTSVNSEQPSVNPEQPYFHVLVDRRGRHDDQTAYVAQEHIVPIPVQPIDHPSFSQPLFTGQIEEQTDTWVPNPLLAEQYPCGIEGCWVVDAVTLDATSL
jgi:hemimethylated DNA binding protein